MNRLTILLFSLLLTASTFAQSPVGTWKRTAMELTDASGKKEDMLPVLTESMPCTPDITYTFNADGTFNVNVPETCGRMKKAIQGMNKPARWSMSGNKLNVTVIDKTYPDSQYTLTVSGNTMTWDFDHAANKQVPNPTKARRVVIKYQKI